MTKKHFFIGVGAIVLTLSADIAVRASARANLINMYVSTIGGGCRGLVIAVPSLGNFTTGGTGVQATISIFIGVSHRKLWGTNTCAAGAVPKLVHFHG